MRKLLHAIFAVLVTERAHLQWLAEIDCRLGVTQRAVELRGPARGERNQLRAARSGPFLEPGHERSTNAPAAPRRLDGNLLYPPDRAVCEEREMVETEEVCDRTPLVISNEEARMIVFQKVVECSLKGGALRDERGRELNRDREEVVDVRLLCDTNLPLLHLHGQTHAAAAAT